MLEGISFSLPVIGSPFVLLRTLPKSIVPWLAVSANQKKRPSKSISDKELSNLLTEC